MFHGTVYFVREDGESRSSSAAVIDVTHALSVGSGTGVNVAEWFEGTGTPVRSLSMIFAGSVALIDQMQIGTPCA